ncbi:hypothetical protein [Shewanella maritima]|uniref:hypothetical protein n=1 Tax=Shewanella maritima TaxID=2520507 RepID=UPI0037353DE7
MIKRLSSFKVPLNASLFQSLIDVLLQPLSNVRQKLSVSQKLYALALIILLLTQSLTWVGVISVVAMAIEFWPIFERMWNSLAGKAFLLLFYAIIANFALAYSSGVVNEVLGVSASHFNYTHNFAILLYIPAWMVITSGLCLLMMQIVYPFYALAAWLLKLLGIKFKRLTNHEDYHRLTFLVRMVLAWVVMYHLFMFMSVSDNELTANVASKAQTEARDETIDEDEYASVAKKIAEIEQSDSAKVMQLQQIASVIDEEIKRNATAASKENTKDAVAANASLTEGSEKADNPSETITNQDDGEVAGDIEIFRPVSINTDVSQDDLQYQAIRDEYLRSVRQAIAIFAFAFEADTFSRCQKAPESKVVVLNDYEILEITPNRKAKYGYEYQVKKCVSPAFPSVKND